MSQDSTDWRRRPGEGRYARREIELRFLVNDSSPRLVATRLICDRYITGTRLRLREVTAEGEHVWKLTQKVRSRSDDPYEVAITNIYLEAQEYELLARLPAAMVTKTRGIAAEGDCIVAVDTFHDRLRGLRLAEIEATDGAPKTLPAWLGQDVTHDDRYSGGSLATATDDEVRQLLAAK